MAPNRRLAKEIASINKDTNEYVDVKIQGDDITRWMVNIKGPPNTPYALGTFCLSFDFKDYPFKPPIVKFITKVYHPNIKTDTGDICAGLLEEGWAPTLTAKHCINVIRNMMAHPELDHPLETEIAQQYIEHNKEFEKAALKCTKEYAIPK